MPSGSPRPVRVAALQPISEIPAGLRTGRPASTSSVAPPIKFRSRVGEDEEDQDHLHRTFELALDVVEQVVQLRVSLGEDREIHIRMRDRQHDGRQRQRRVDA